MIKKDLNNLQCRCKGFESTIKGVINNYTSMDDTSLIRQIEDIKNLMIKVATWISDIQDVNDSYQKLYISLLQELKKRNIDNYNDFFSLWDFYNYWKGNDLNTYQSRRSYIWGLYKHVSYQVLTNTYQWEKQLDTYSYFAKEKIEELEKIKNWNFDTSKIIKILEEVNFLYENKMYLWISALLRMLMDHIPPIFSKTNFNQVVSEWSFWGSDKKIIERLKDLYKHVADSHLHTQITPKEILPNKNTIEFKVEFDTLTKYIILELNK